MRLRILFQRSQEIDRRGLKVRNYRTNGLAFLTIPMTAASYAKLLEETGIATAPGKKRVPQGLVASILSVTP